MRCLLWPMCYLEFCFLFSMYYGIFSYLSVVNFKFNCIVVWEKTLCDFPLLGAKRIFLQYGAETCWPLVGKYQIFGLPCEWVPLECFNSRAVHTVALAIVNCSSRFPILIWFLPVSLFSSDPWLLGFTCLSLEFWG